MVSAKLHCFALLTLAEEDSPLYYQMQLFVSFLSLICMNLCIISGNVIYFFKFVFKVFFYSHILFLCIEINLLIPCVNPRFSLKN